MIKEVNYPQAISSIKRREWWKKITRVWDLSYSLYILAIHPILISSSKPCINHKFMIIILRFRLKNNVPKMKRPYKWKRKQKTERVLTTPSFLSCSAMVETSHHLFSGQTLSCNISTNWNQIIQKQPNYQLDIIPNDPYSSVRFSKVEKMEGNGPSKSVPCMSLHLDSSLITMFILKYVKELAKAFVSY